MRKGIGECRAITLTTGLDNVAGTSGNDTISGAVNINATGTSTVNSFSAADVINGGDGVDTLNVIIENSNGAPLAFPGAAISNVEVFNVRNVEVAGNGLTINAANFAGETEVNADRSTNAVTINNLGTGAAAGIIGNGSGGNGALTFNYATASAAATLNVRDGAGVTAQPAVTINSAPTAVTINSTGAANSLGAVALGGAATSLTIDAATALSTGSFTGLAATGATITVKGAASGVSSPNAVPAAATVTLGNIQGGVNLTSIDASGLTAGGVQVGMNAASTNLQFKGGAGNDNVTTNGVTALLSTASIDAGAGTADRLVVANTNDIVVAGDALSKARGDLYKGFEQVQVQNGVSINLDLLATNNTIDAVRINDGVGATGVTNLSATGAQNVTVLATDVLGSADSQITIGVKGATTTGQIDTVKVAAQTTIAAQASNDINLNNVVLSGVENLEITGSNGALAANVGAVTLTTQSAIDLGSIKLNNANTSDATVAFGAAAGVSFIRTAGVADNVITVDQVNNAHRAINLTIDATGSGDTQVNASAYNTATGAHITTGAGNDLLLGSRNADVLVAGAGNDVLQGDVIAAVAATSGSTTIDLNNLFVAQNGGVNTPQTLALTIDGNNIGGAIAGATTANALGAQVAGALVTAGYTASNNNGVVTITGTPGSAIVAADVENLQAVYDIPNATVAGATSAFVAGSAATDRVIDLTVSTVAADTDVTVSLTDGSTKTVSLLATNSALQNAAAIITAINADGAGGTVTDTVSAALVGTNTVRLTMTGTTDRTGVTANLAGVLASDGTTSVDLVAAGFADGDAGATGGAAVVANAETVTFADITGLTFGDTVTYTLNGVTRVLTATGATINGAAIAADFAGVAGAGEVGGPLGTQVGATATLTYATATAGNDTSSYVINYANKTSANVATEFTGGTADNTAIVREVAGTAAGNQTLFAADTLTGGEGKDVFVVLGNGVGANGQWNNGSTFTTMDTITDLNLGTAAQAGRVDVIDLTFAINTLVNAGQAVAMNAQATNLFNAVNGLYTPGAALNGVAAGTAGIFTYNGDTYLIADATGAADGFNAVGGDVIVKITGVTGTLDASDFV